MKPVLDREIPAELVWHDEFTGDLSLWDQPDFVDSDDRTGNKFLKLDGSIDLSWGFSKIPGRYAALYNDHRDKCQFIRDGHLVMKGYAVKARNPYRDNFTDAQGNVHAYGDNMLYTAWMEIKERFTKGTILEVRVNLENQQMGGHRWNFWGMPVDGPAYTADPRRAEWDGPEVENPSRATNNSFGTKAILKLIGGDSGNTPQDLDENGNDIGAIDLLKRGINLRSGWHTFTTIWNLDGSVVWLVDGIECNRDDRNLDMVLRVILAREMNSGVKELSKTAIETFNTHPELDVAIVQYNASAGREPDARIDTLPLLTAFIATQDTQTNEGRRAVDLAQKVVKPWENYANGPKRPRDDGLTAQSVASYLDLIEEDEVLVDYVRVYRITGETSPKIDEPDVDVGDPVSIDDLTIDEKIAILASHYEQAKAKVTEQAAYIVTLVQSVSDANAMADEKTTELAAYREQTTATINRLKQTENGLRAEIDALKKKPAPAPTPVVVAPPVSKKSLDRLNALLRRAGRG